MPGFRPMSATAVRSWARVRILLNLGDVGAATTQALAASSRTNWAQLGPTLTWGAACIHSTPELPSGWCWVEPGEYRVLLSQSVVEEFGMSNALAEFTDVVETMTEPGFRSFDPQNWAELDRLGF